mgnify:CR=1 FL=1
MYNRQFFATRLGQAALASIAAMVLVNLVTFAMQFQSGPANIAMIAGQGTLA